MVNYKGMRLSELENLVRGRRTLVVTLGNEFRGDDAVGVMLAEYLVEAGYQDVVLNAGIMLENLIALIIRRNPDVIIFVDAIDAKLKPGDIYICRLDETIDEITPLTTHKLPLRFIAKFIKSELPNSELILIGVQAKNYTFGSIMSNEVKNSLEALKQLIRKLLTISTL